MQVMGQALLKEKIEKNSIVALKSKGDPVLVGEGLSLKVNASVGLNAREEFCTEREKVKEIQRHTVHPDTMMDLKRCYKGGAYRRDTDHPLHFGGY